MDRLVDFGGQPFHFIGIGGIGMSALAYVLAENHLPVSGSDLRATNITQRLQAVGAHIFVEQEPQNLNFFQTTQIIKDLEQNHPPKYQTYDQPLTLIPQII